MGETVTERKAGLVIVLPKYESTGSVRRLGPFMVFVNVAFDRFGVGYQILKAGVIIQAGPVYFGICHIENQGAAFDAEDASTPPSGEPT
jgi:hypothetical protein